MTSETKDIVKSIEKLNMHLEENNYYYAYATAHDRKFETELEQSLSEFTGLDILDEDNKFICRNCKLLALLQQIHCIVLYIYNMHTYIPHLGNNSEVAQQRVSRWILIHQLPPVLILQLKRFSIDDYGVTKDNDDISFPLILNVAPYCTKECVQVSKDVMYVRK